MALATTERTDTAYDDLDLWSPAPSSTPWRRRSARL